MSLKYNYRFEFHYRIRCSLLFVKYMFCSLCSFKEEEVNGLMLLDLHEQLVRDRTKFGTDIGSEFHLRFMQVTRFCAALKDLDSFSFSRSDK